MRKKTLKKLVQRLLFGIGILSLGITFTGCHASHSQTDSQKTISRQTEPQAGPAQTETSSTLSLIDASGMTLESRIHTPDGYARTKEADGSLAEFLRNYAMEPDQSPVLLYDGSKKRNQKAHVAVFDLPLEHEDLQQCADSAIRVYAEYFWSTKQYDRIAFPVRPVRPGAAPQIFPPSGLRPPDGTDPRQYRSDTGLRAAVRRYVPVRTDAEHRQKHAGYRHVCRLPAIERMAAARGHRP